MATALPVPGTESIVVCERHVPEHEARFAGTTVGSGFRYSVIRIIGGNMRDPMPVSPAIVRVQRWLRDV
jgi:hypothetical protein